VNSQLRTDFGVSSTKTRIFLPSPSTTYADIFVDVAANSIIGDSGDEANFTYYSDLVHLTNAGYGLIATDAKAGFDVLQDKLISPTVSITSPTNGSSVSGIVTITANSSDNVGVVGVQFKLDDTTNIGVEDVTNPYSTSLDTTTIPDGAHTITAISGDAASNSTTSSTVNITVANVVPPVIHQNRPLLFLPNNPPLNMQNIITEIENTTETFKPTLNLKKGQINSQVKSLQQYLNTNDFIVSQEGFGSPGKETSFFGPLTKAALIKFQKAKGIKPASGYFGPTTRSYINSH
jgi:hypothetical protein